MTHVLSDDSLAFVHMRIFEIQGGGDCRCTYRLSHRSDCVMLMQWVSLMTVKHQADVLITTIRLVTSCERIKLVIKRNGKGFLWLAVRFGGSFCQFVA